jgi:hypothetical protein
MEETPIKNLIGAWGSRRALAEEIGATVAQVHKWADSGRIPSRWQASVIEAAQRRGMNHVTAEWMVQVHAQPREAAE